MSRTQLELLSTGSSSEKAPTSSKGARDVFECWRRYRPRPELCRFTADRKKLIQDRMKLGYTAEDLIALVRYVNEGNTGFTRWMNGDNPRNRKYLDLTNLFRKEKLGQRVEEARLWMNRDNDPDPGPSDGLDLGPLGDFR